MSTLPERPLDVERIQTVLDLHLAKPSQSTRDAYSRDLAHFAGWTRLDPSEAVRALLCAGPGHANELALRYVADMRDQVSPATINRRLSALRSLVKLARTVGLIDWALTVSSEKAEAYRDTAGPGVEAVRAMLVKLRERGDAKGVRDTAIIRLLFDVALRRGEVRAFDVGDIYFDAKCLWVTAKGKSAKVKVTMPEPTAAALRAWLDVRAGLSVTDDAVFADLDNRRDEHSRMSLRAFNKIVGKLGLSIGREARPHGLRHSAITCALDKTGGDVRAVQRFSRHAKPETLLAYDDNRQDLAGSTAAKVADSL